ncbi:YdcH family protein [Rhizorhabdus argentea]|uniref:YdcH family protein n=1 Tax=Rhizorhabdus argentea TaxID=1387174 RepID=UPI0030EF2CE6
MSNKFLAYLEREHARLEQLVADEARKLRPNETELARLKKMKLAVKDQIVAWQHDVEALASA